MVKLKRRENALAQRSWAGMEEMERRHKVWVKKKEKEEKKDKG